MVKSALLLGIIIFSLSSIYFSFSDNKKPRLNSAFLINFITLISYLLMYQSNILSYNSLSQPVYYTRWIFYALSCSLLMYEITNILKSSKDKMVERIFLTMIVMLTGAYSAVSLGFYKILYFTLSSIAYLMLIKGVVSETKSANSFIKNYIYFGWNLFPLIFIFAPAGLGLISAYTANIFYLLLDIYTKIHFSTKFHA